QLRARGARARLGGERVMSDDAHLEAGRAARDLRADAADADQAQCLAAQLAADELRARPLAGADAAVRVGDAPEQGERERERVLGRRDDVPERRVHDVYAARGRRGNVDVVDADAGAARRGDRLTGLDRLIEVAQRELQGAEEVQDVLQRHEAEVTDADELPVQLALPARDDRVVVVTQHTNEVARIDARRWTERGDGRRRMRFVGEQRQIERLQSATGGAGEIQMTAEDRLEPFLGHEAERLLQRDVDAHRRRRRRRALLERGLRRREVEVRLW